MTVHLGEKSAPLGRDGEASILKNYIDLKSERTEYTIIILTPSVVDGVNIFRILTFVPQNHTLVETKRMLPDDGSKPTVTEWDDATYTSIVNAVEINDFTNNPGKVGFFES